MVRTRFAPSPTGNMTIGNLRTALYEYLIAKHYKGVFILRIEDTDQNRYVEGTTDVIYNTLSAVGLAYDEGPGVGGDYGPYIQSERKADYLPFARQLVEKGKAYYCFCSKDRLDGLADERGHVKYDRHCLRLSQEEINQKLASGEPFVIRQIIPEGQTTFHDQVFGDITIQNEEMEDQILVKSDGMPTYNFANVVDDHAMCITHVVRGCEYLTSTPKYNLLYDAFGWDIPVYVHLPLLLNEDGGKISKRKGDPSIQELLAMGYLPEAVVNYAALLGWSPPDNREIFTLVELAAAFDPKNISKSPSLFDPKKFAWVNGEHIKRMSPENFYQWVLPTLQEAIKMPGIDLLKVAGMLQSRISFAKDCVELVDFIDCLPDYDLSLFTHKKMKTDAAISLETLGYALDLLAQTENWENNHLYETLTACAESHGIKNSQILWPIRTALSGKLTSPCGATELCELLGKKESLNRLRIAVDKLKAV